MHAWTLLSLVLHMQVPSFAKAKFVIAEMSLTALSRYLSPTRERPSGKLMFPNTGVKHAQGTLSVAINLTLSAQLT